MKLRDFIKNLQDFAQENPAALEAMVITSKDDEGNGYNKVYYTPTLGQYNESDMDFQSKESLEEEGYFQIELNAVCVN